MCSARGATVRDVAARDYVTSLASLLMERRVIRTPNKLKVDIRLGRLYFEEAAELLRSYYLHPSFVVPTVPRRVRTPGEKEKALKLLVREAAFRELMRVQWLRCDERCRLVLVSELAVREMDTLAASMKPQSCGSARPREPNPEEEEEAPEAEPTLE